MASGENPLKHIAAREIEDWMKAMFDWRAKDFVVTADVQSMHHDGAPFSEASYLRVNLVLRAEPKLEVPAADVPREIPTPGTPDEPEKRASVIEDLEF